MDDMTRRQAIKQAATTGAIATGIATMASPAPGQTEPQRASGVRAPGGLKDTLLTFSNLVASVVLPEAAAKVVTAVIPGVVDFLLGAEDLRALVEGEGEIIQYITTQEGVTFRIAISQKEHTEVFNALKAVHQKAKDPSSGANQHVQYFALQAQVPSGNAAAGGAFSFLNGIIGVQW